MSPADRPEPAATPRRPTRVLLAAVILALGVGVVLAGSALLGMRADPAELAAWQSLDRRWGPFLSEREWGTPREAIGGDGWALRWKGAITREYRYADDGIAGHTDSAGEFRVGWAFWDGLQEHVTERFDGAANPSGAHGETILEDRVFHEQTPTASYARMTYRYPFAAPTFEIELESARVDATRMVLRATATNVSDGPATLHVVAKGWLDEGGSVEAGPSHLRLPGATSTVEISGRPADSWQASSEKAALDQALRGGGLVRAGSGHIGALAYRLDLAAGATDAVTVALVEVPGDGTAPEGSLLTRADAIIATRREEAAGAFGGRVTEHEALFGQALSGLLWSRSFYRWDGSSSRAPEWAGTVDARDVLIMPDKWEFPWLASWDTAFHAVTATLIDPTMAADEIRFILSDRWQQPDGHVPCAEWVMADECPPIFAWAAWRIFEAGGDRAFLEGVYPSLARHYAYWWDAKAVEPRGLFTGGFLGMDNLPRGGGRAAQADASAWMALFAADLARIARELGDEAAAERYDADRSTIAAAVDATLWDPETRFYHDLNASGQHLQVPSYSGLVPLIAGIVPAERVGPLLEALRDEDRFLSPGGIRSVDAAHPIYTPAYAAGRVNSNWLGPVWVPLQYLLIHALEEVDPALASDVRDRVVTNVKRQWLATGRLWEYYDGDTGVGLGADAQAGWTALVANLIVEGWPAP